MQGEQSAADAGRRPLSKGPGEAEISAPSPRKPVPSSARAATASRKRFTVRSRKAQFLFSPRRKSHALADAAGEWRASAEALTLQW
ncbi:hypothetical protein EVAR_92710_1 [Eumeta japonica]|uniref:Uncharacterized protein n=1 Tax=Eumeta variegata TaxID=151549 RepID=A0A4C1SXY4_EUMVA|nr:hypothetical protein EVAR_92710_1 [Eumeta japonica]